jgi:DNA-binding MarR family transcriptional regulator
MAEDPADRRRLVIETTPEGAELAARVRPVARELREALVAGFSPGELDALRASFRRMLANLDRFEARRARRAVRPLSPARAASREERP